VTSRAAAPGAPRYGLLLLPAGLIFAPFYAAMLLIVAVSFVEYAGLRSGEVVFTLSNYAAALLDGFNQAVLIRTIRVGVIVGIVSAIAATPMAYAIVRTKRPRIRLALILVTIVPFLVNALVRVFALTTVLGREGFLNFVLVGLGLVERPGSFLRTEFAVVLGQTYFVLPFAILTITALMAKLNENVEHAAATLGANPWQTFFRITLPRLYPAIFSAGLIAYALSVSAFVVPLILGGDRYKMYSNLIYDQVAFSGDFGRAAALAIVLLVFSVSLAEILRLLLVKTVGPRR
jgi:putative spermidine/putrescine transport system permease protein